MTPALSSGGLDSREKVNKIISDVNEILNAISASVQTQINDFVTQVYFS